MANFRNPTYQDLMQGFSDRMTALGQPFKLMRTGETFNAIGINLQPIDPRLDLGSDPRAHGRIEARRDQLPEGILTDDAYGDIIQQINPPWNTATFKRFPLWKLVNREDNGLSFSIIFYCVQVADVDQERGTQEAADQVTQGLQSKS